MPIFLIPAPSRVAESLYTMVGSGLLFEHFAITFFEALGGFAIAFGCAALFAALITESRLAERVLYLYFTALQAMPKVAIAPLIVIWFGYGFSSKIVLAALMAFFPMLVNFVEGLRAADEGRLKLMRAMDASRWQILRYVKIPYALPFFFAGVELGGLYAMLGAIVAEFVGASAGIGNWLIAMNLNLDTASTFALLLVLATYGMAFQKLISALRKRALFWARSDEPVAQARSTHPEA
ncbi:MAG: ABC transporter permease [Pseudomonadota bacterium]